MLVQPSRDTLGISGVVIEVVLQALDVPFLETFIVDLLKAKVLGGGHPIGFENATPACGVAAIAAIALGWEIKVSLA